jgi:2-methylisocitrate lyase-like PEP mutase family enzyme
VSRICRDRTCQRCIRFGPAGATTYTGFFAGAIDDVAFYASALTGAQVAAIYAAPDGECH